MRKGSTLSYLLTDHLGSTALTATSSGARSTELRYKAWGETRYTYGTTPTTYRFTGQREDSTIALYFYNARYYDVSLGRFIQADTLVPDPADPQSFNRYSYVRNNPLKHVDPTGHMDDVGDYLSGGGGQTDPDVSGLWDPAWVGSVGDADKVAAEQAFVHLLDDPGYFAQLYTDPKAWNASEEVAALDLFAQYSMFHTRAEHMVLAPYGWDARDYARAANMLYGLGADQEDVSKYAAFLLDDSGSSAGLAIAAISVPELIAAAEEQYPAKAGGSEWHHYIPKYLGGESDGTQYNISAAYHQYITNEFRQAWGYGRLGKPDPKQLQSILRQVYGRYPIPSGSERRGR